MREGHKVVLFSNTEKHDKVTEKYKKLENILWVDINNKSATEVCDTIQDLEINVLFDLSGHTAVTHWKFLQNQHH